jgi:hypothetical protein
MPQPNQGPHISNLINNPYNQPGMNQLRPMNFNQQPQYEPPTNPQNVRPYQSTLPQSQSAPAEDLRASKRVRVSRACKWNFFKARLPLYYMI